MLVTLCGGSAWEKAETAAFLQKKLKVEVCCGMELMIPLDTGEKRPLYEQIYQYVKDEIRSGRLKAGDRLPSTRLLADNLKISRCTTQMAYEQLLSEGYIESVPCKGYYIAGIEELVRMEREPEPGLVFPRQEVKKGPVVDFSPRGVDLERFPFNAWRKISKNTLVDDNKEMFAAGDPQGEYGLRAAVGNYLYTARGVHVRPEQIIIGAGSEYLWMLLAQILGGPRRMAMENPTYKQAYRVFSGVGMEVVPISMDASGMRIYELENSGADIAYVMPGHQYPTGIVMPVKRRQELLMWAMGGKNRYLIEDDYDSEFRYKGKPIPSLQGMDTAGKVIYIGTFSKSIAPAIRVGYLALPEKLLGAYRQRAGFYTSTVSRIDQNILYQFMIQGHYERHLNRMRAVYKAKHDGLLTGLRELEDIFEIHGEHAGLHVLMTHRGGIAEDELVERAAKGGVKVYGLSGALISPDPGIFASTVLLGYGRLSLEEIQEGTERLKSCWK